MNRLRIYRRRAGLTQQELAQLLGYQDAGPIGAYEREARDLSLRNAIGYGIIFDVPITDLVPDLAAEVYETIRCQAAILRATLADDAAPKLALQKLLERVVEQTTERLGQSNFKMSK